MKLVDLLGCYGVLAILLAYGLLNFSFVQPKDLIYIFLNLSGSLSLLVEAWSKKDYQPVVLNIIWASIAAITLVNLAIHF